jgi:hypothetical protein
MNFELEGTLIVKNDTQIISDRFKKREFVVEKKETSENGFEFVDTIKFQWVQDKVGVIDDFQLGASINVHFNIKGNKWEKGGKVNYFVNLDAWRIEEATGKSSSASQSESQAAPPPAEEDIPLDDGTEDLPF